MGKNIIRFILVVMAIFLNSLAVLYTLNLYIRLKPNILKIATIFLLIVSIIILLILLFKLDIKNSTILKTVIHTLNQISLIIFLVCTVFIIFKLENLNVERGTSLYDKISLPSIAPLGASILLWISQKIN